MTTLPLAEPSDELEPGIETTRRVTATIGRNVMTMLGRPDDLFQVAVRPLWDNHYRVNVLIGSDSVSARIANSYFVSTDHLGAIIDSQPKVTLKYGPYDTPHPS